jgi:hypothetical protein
MYTVQLDFADYQHDFVLTECPSFTTVKFSGTTEQVETRICQDINS